MFLMHSPEYWLTNIKATTHETKHHFDRYPGLPSKVQKLPEIKALHYLNPCSQPPLSLNISIVISVFHGHVYSQECSRATYGSTLYPFLYY